MESIKKNYVTESKIMDDIILDINEGRYEVDEKLPSANELADKYKGFKNKKYVRYMIG